MPLLRPEWSSDVTEEDASALLEQEEELKRDLYNGAQSAGEQLRDGRVARADVHGPKVEYKATGQPKFESTEAWLSNCIRFVNSETVSLYTRKVVTVGETREVVDGSERTPFTVSTGGPRIEIDSDELAVADVKQRVAFLKDAIETLQLIDKAEGEPVLVPLDEPADEFRFAASS